MPELKACLGVRFTVALVCLALALPAIGNAQTRRQIKVLVESKQSGTQNQEGVQGSGSVIIRRGNVQPSGRVTAAERQTTVQRSTGIFTLVQDGAESILSVATRVPYSEAAYYYNYAAGNGYLQRNIVFTDVGTSLRVSASVLPDNQIRVRLTPRISYFSAERAGAIDFTEATTELIVPHGQPVSLGGSTTQVHEITRQILGYRDRVSSSETHLVLTATIQ
jgi:type II secretory pathway component GspD/PulD (secretin)